MCKLGNMKMPTNVLLLSVNRSFSAGDLNEGEEGCKSLPTGLHA
jgi:hypothetical protein